MKKFIAAIFITLISLMSAPAFAQVKPKLNPPCLEPVDARPACKNGVFAPGQPGAVVGNNAAIAADPTAAAGNCDFGTFGIITPQNLVATIQACGETLLTDSNAALASAKAANDSVALSCLTPGTALIQAGVGIPGSPGDPNATPPVPSTPAKLGGPILTFQKYREFVNSGGISACQSWVGTVVAATAGAAVNGLAGAAGAAAVLSPIK